MQQCPLTGVLFLSVSFSCCMCTIIYISLNFCSFFGISVNHKLTEQYCMSPAIKEWFVAYSVILKLFPVFIWWWDPTTALSTSQPEAEVFLNADPFAIKGYFSKSRKWFNFQLFEITLASLHCDCAQGSLIPVWIINRIFDEQSLRKMACYCTCQIMLLLCVVTVPCKLDSWHVSWQNMTVSTVSLLSWLSKDPRCLLSYGRSQRVGLRFSLR